MEFCIGFGWFALAIVCAAVFGFIACFVMFWTGDMELYDLTEEGSNDHE
jgi:hypothetical protein